MFLNGSYSVKMTSLWLLCHWIYLQHKYFPIVMKNDLFREEDILYNQSI